MSDAVRDALATAQQMSAANNNAPFELHIQMNDGTDIHGMPYPIGPEVGSIRLQFLPLPDPAAPFPPPSDRWISPLAVLWVEIEWLLGADTGSGAPPSDLGEDTEPAAAAAAAKGKSEPAHASRKSPGRGKY